MTSIVKSSALTVSAEEKSNLGIDIVLPAIESREPWSDQDASSILFLTDGYITFFLGSVNVFEVSGTAWQNTLDKSHSHLNLSMLLEWVLFDKSYLPLGGSSSFSELISAESSPPLSFTLRGSNVDIEWNFDGLKRCGGTYLTPTGREQVGYSDYLKILSTTIEALVIGIERRAQDLLLERQWHKWWSGYDADANDFRDFMHKWSN